MEPNTVPIGRIELPEDWEPEGIVCARVPIPDDPQYFSMLIGLVDQLRNSAMFGRDPTRTGAAIVSRTWENALNSMPIIIINCEGDEMPTLLRDDPGDPCAVQQSIDGGATWSHAFFKNCGDEAVIPTPTDAAAEGAGNFMWNWYVNTSIMLNANPTRADFITDWCALMATIGVTFETAPYTDCASAAGNLWDNWQSEMTGTDKADAIDPCFWAPKFDEIQSCFDDGGVMDWLNCASATLSDWLNDISNAFFHDLSFTASLLSGESGQALADYDAGGGGGAGFAGDCAGTFECIDFRDTPGGFVRVGAYGQWLDGVGWKAQINASDYWVAHIRKSSGFPATTPGNIRVVYTPTGNSKVARLFVNGVMVKEQLGGSAGYRQLNYTPTGPVTSVEIYVSQNNLNSSLTISEFCITE